MLKSLFATLACILTLHFTMNAQQQLTWKAQNVSITLPDDFKVTVNNDTEFKAQGNTPERWVHMFQVDYSLKIEEGTEELSPEGLDYASDKYKMGSTDEYRLFETPSLQAFCKDSYKNGKKAFFTGYKNKKTGKEFIVVLAYDYASDAVLEEFFEYIKSVTN